MTCEQLEHFTSRLLGNLQAAGATFTRPLPAPQHVIGIVYTMRSQNIAVRVSQAYDVRDDLFHYAVDFGTLSE